MERRLIIEVLGSTEDGYEHKTTSYSQSVGIDCGTALDTTNELQDSPSVSLLFLHDALSNNVG
jgi:hypothetical protein